MNPTWPHRIAHSATLLALLLLGACSGDDAVTDPNKLCARGAGLAARISGTPEPIDFCVANDQTVATYTGSENRYRVTATFLSDSLEVTISVSFQIQPGQPRDLNISSDSTIAFTDPGGAYFYYREVKPGAYDHEVSSVTGTFRLTVTDTHVATGTFTDLALELEDSSGTPAGQRVIKEGFFAVTPD
jgi:hypothetical protein